MTPKNFGGIGLFKLLSYVTLKPIKSIYIYVYKGSVGEKCHYTSDKWQNKKLCGNCYI